MLPSPVFSDIGVGLAGAVLLKGIVYVKGKNAKNFQGEEYGSARWGIGKDIEPFEDPVFKNQYHSDRDRTAYDEQRLKNPKYAPETRM